MVKRVVLRYDGRNADADRIVRRGSPLRFPYLLIGLSPFLYLLYGVECRTGLPSAVAFGGGKGTHLCHPDVVVNDDGDYVGPEARAYFERVALAAARRTSWRAIAIWGLDGCTYIDGEGHVIPVTRTPEWVVSILRDSQSLKDGGSAA